MKYPGGTTTNMTSGNNAGTVGLDASIFTVSSKKNSASNAAGLNSDGTIRLYAKSSDGNGTDLTISVGGTSVIKSITIEFGSTVGSFTVNGTAGSKSTTTYEINSSSVKIQNVTAGATTQVHIKSIQITYTPS